jgi:hypothetical protein
VSTQDQSEIQEQHEPRCRLCGQPITEPEFVDVGLCGDCYLDDQTNADGTIEDE